jgi:predicted signal transduction protein with EAL and GGDEF domain
MDGGWLQRGPPVKNLHIEHDGQTLAVITVSLGVALLPDQGDDGESVLESADAALYRAKESGRSQVVTATWGRQRAHRSPTKIRSVPAPAEDSANTRP